MDLKEASQAEAIKMARLYAKLNPRWGNPEYADGNCLVASESFRRWMRAEKRRKSKLVYLAAERSRYVYHWIVEVGNILVDMTARQFNKHMPYPRLLTGKEVRKEWKHVKTGWPKTRAGNEITY